MNFRLNMNYEEAVELSTNSWCSQSLDNMLKFDQLSIARKKVEFCKKYNEMPIEFKPTFKFDKRSDNYDTSKKMRVPSWTDRILWYHKEKYIVPISYESKDNRFSDHRPVLGIFKILAHEHVEEMKE